MRDRLDAFLDRYGYDGRHVAGWARLSPRLELLFLEAEKRRGTVDVVRQRRTPDEQLFLLRIERWLRWLLADRDRQALVAHLLGVQPGRGRRPFVWCWEHQPAETLPVAYPSDWERDRWPDLYGLGHRWVEGEVLVIPVDEVPAEAVVVGEAVRVSSPAPPDAKALLDGIDEAEVVSEPVERPLAEGRVRVRFNSPPKMIGTWDPSSGFRPSGGSPW